MAVSGIIFQMITLFIMMFAGYLAARAGLISPSFRRGLSSLVLSTAFPCCIVSSVLQSGGAPGDMVVALGVSVAFFALLIALAAVLVCIVPTPKPERSLDQLMLVFTNLAFMGIPIIQVFYGAQGVAMLSMFLLVFNFLVFTYGVMLVSGNGSINLRQLVNPGPNRRRRRGGRTDRLPRPVFRSCLWGILPMHLPRLLRRTLRRGEPGRRRLALTCRSG